MSGDYFRQAFYTSPAAKAIIVRATGEFLDANDAFFRLVGYSRDQVIGRNTVELNLWEDEGECARLFQRLETESYVPDLEARIKTKTGEVRVLQIVVEPVQLDDRPYLTLTARDITAQKQARSDQQETEATLQAVVDGISDLVWSVDPQSFGLVTYNCALYDYFFRTHNIQIAAGMRPQDLFPTQDYVDLWVGFYTRALAEGHYDFEYTSYSGAYTLSLSLNLLRRNGAVFGISVFGQDVTALKAALHEAQELNRTLEERIARRTAELQWLYDSAPTGYLSLDLSNAVKFTPAGGHVALRVTLDEAAQLIHFAVADTGIGIAPEGLAQLFQPFSQLDSMLVRQHQGTGLGLALVKELAEQHGGSVTAASAGPGQGSCFTISLPYRA